MSISGRLDQHLFHVMEVQNNSAAYLEKRKNVIEVWVWTNVNVHFAKSETVYILVPCGKFLLHLNAKNRDPCLYPSVTVSCNHNVYHNITLSSLYNIRLSHFSSFTSTLLFHPIPSQPFTPPLSTHPSLHTSFSPLCLFALLQCLSHYKDHMRQQSREPKDMRERAVWATISFATTWFAYMECMLLFYSNFSQEPSHSQTPSGSSLNKLQFGEEVWVNVVLLYAKLLSSVIKPCYLLYVRL